MPFVTVLKTGTKIHVEFNDLTILAETRKACFADTAMLSAQIKNFNDGSEYIEVHIEDANTRWRVSLDGNHQSLIIQSINNVTPTDIDHLQELLCDLMA